VDNITGYSFDILYERF